jgi:GntR family transcriptional regulator / MocR family aminotransferase
MQDPGTTSVSPELLVELDRQAYRPLHAQLSDGLRSAVRTGRLAAGAALPSSRALAGDLGVSRRLVVDTYAQLVAEGYLVTRPGAGTFVAATAATTPPASEEPPCPPSFDFFAGNPDLAGFPRAAWAGAVRDALRAMPDADLGYPDPRGVPALRTALAGYLARARGVVVDPGRVLVVGGAVQGLVVLTRVLARETTPVVVAVERPGLPVHRIALHRAGAVTRPIAVDDDGIVVDDLAASDAHAAVVTAAHQMPTGVALSIPRRTTIVAWARAGGLLIEDDYDAEFRYDRRPLSALQGLAPDHVAYLGSASKSLAPGLRLAWLVLPAHLVEAAADEKTTLDSGTDVVGQHALARLIDSGRYDRHLRACRRRYRARRDALVAAVHQHLPGARVLGVAAGLHATIQLPQLVDPKAVVAACERRSVRVSDVRPHLLVLGYANLTVDAIAEGVHRIATVLHETA